MNTIFHGILDLLIALGKKLLAQTAPQAIALGENVGKIALLTVKFRMSNASAAEKKLEWDIAIDALIQTAIVAEEVGVIGAEEIPSLIIQIGAEEFTKEIGLHD